MAKEKYNVNSVNIKNVSSYVNIISQIFLDNPGAKEAELTTLFKCLLSAGIYESINAAVLQGVPKGTFVIIDDPKTPELDFDIKVV
jgi:hypothetical protein